MYLLVEFIDEKNLAVIPDSWLDGNSCALWPSWKNPTKLTNAVKKNVPPSEDWKAFPIKEIYRNESYDKVRFKLKLAELESDVATGMSNESDDSDVENTRKSKRKKRKVVLTSSDENEIDVETPVTHKPLPALPMPPVPILLSPASAGPSNRPQPSPRLDNTPTRPAIPSSKTSSDTIRMISKLFTEIEKQGDRMDQLQKNCETILQKISIAAVGASATEKSSFSTPENINLPMETLAEIEASEIELETPDVMENMINYLSLVGGKNKSDMVRRVLGHTLKSKAAQNFNWFGKKGKRPFGALRLAVVVRRAVQKTFRGTTNAEVEFAVREWLRTAGDREGGRAERKRKSLSDLNTD